MLTLLVLPPPPPTRRVRGHVSDPHMVAEDGAAAGHPGRTSGPRHLAVLQPRALAARLRAGLLHHSFTETQPACTT